MSDVGRLDAPISAAIPASRSRSWRRPPKWVSHVLLLYLTSRLVVAGASLAAALLRMGSLRTWDAVYYLSIVRDGYPTDTTSTVAGTHGNSLAFFPGFPLLVRAVGDLVGGHGQVVALLVNGVLGGVAALGFRVLAAELWNDLVADRSVALWLFWPGSAILSLPYAEALALAAAIWAFVLLFRHRWVTAGLLAAVATGTRPNMLPIAAAFAVYAVVQVVQDRRWQALAAPLLAPAGMLAYFAYTRVHVGTFRAWSEVEAGFWHQRLDFGVDLPAYVREHVTPPFGPESAQAFLLLLGTAVLVVVLVAIPFRRLTLPVLTLLVFAAGVLALALGYSNFGPRPRFLLSAFPIFLLLGAWFDATTTRVWVLASSGALALTTLLFLTAPRAIP